LNRIDRLHAILTHLQSKRKITAQQIADRFNISLRTVYRDVKALEESGVPVIGEAGSGYTIMEGYRLPPIMFTQEEAAALLMGGKLAQQMTDSSIQKNHDDAMFKIQSVLRTADKDYVEQLLRNIEVTRPRIKVEEASDKHLVALQKAVAEKKLINIRYQSSKESITERQVEPVGLWHYGQHWHLIGWCRLRHGYRDFRVNRMLRLQLKDETYKSRSYDSLKEYISKEADFSSSLKEMIILFDKAHSHYVIEARYQQGFIKQEEVGNKIRMHFLTPHPEYFARWLLMYTDLITIESPISLKAIMKKLLAELKKAHQ
jgi:predicted DNA-binding transcriptional regulator YafY